MTLLTDPLLYLAAALAIALVVFVLLVRATHVSHFGWVVAAVGSDGRTRYLGNGISFVNPFAKVIRVDLRVPFPDIAGHRGVVVAAVEPAVGLGVARFGGTLVPIRAPQRFPVGAQVIVEGEVASAQMIGVRPTTSH